MIQLVLMLACAQLSLDDSPEQKLAPQAVPAEVQRQPLEPFDEGKDDPDFVAFRKRLLKALDDRDFEYLMSIIPDEEFKCSVGSCESKDEFVVQWDLPSPESPLWSVMKDCLTQGGRFRDWTDAFQRQRHDFIFPYYGTGLGLDFSDGVIIDSDVPLKAKPADDSTTLEQLVHEVVEVLDWTPTERPKWNVDDPHVQAQSVETESPWVQVRARGKEGFVSRKLVRSALGYRGCFEFMDGKWVLQTFLAGD